MTGSKIIDFLKFFNFSTIISIPFPTMLIFNAFGGRSLMILSYCSLIMVFGR